MGICTYNTSKDNNCQYIQNENDFYDNQIKEIISNKDNNENNYKKNNNNNIKNKLLNICNNNESLNDNEIFFSSSFLAKTNNNFVERIYYIDKELLIMSLLIEINKVRTEPSMYIPIIEKYMSYIKKESKKKFDFIQISPFNAIVLKNGKKSFENAIDFLNNQNSVNPLKLEQKIQINFPIKIKDYCNNDEIEKIIKNKLEELKNYNLKKNIKNKYYLENFHFDVNTVNAQASILMQIIDDNQDDYLRRKNLFNQNFNIIGINLQYVSKDILCYYFSFGNVI